MIKRREILSIVAVLVVVLTTVGFARARQEVDLTKWREQLIVVTPFELTFRIPPGKAEAYGNPKIVLRAAVDVDPLPPSRALPLFNHTWSYDESFWRGTMGSLQMIIALERSDVRLLDGDELVNLESAVRRELEAYYVPHTEEVRRLNREDLVVLLPRSYTKNTLNDRQWLMYKLGGWKDQVFYVTPLTDDKYLSVSFDFIDNTRGRRSEWRREAQKVSESITGSINIRRQGR